MNRRPDNEARAMAADRAIREHSREGGLVQPGEEVREAARRMIGDLLHWTDRHSPDRRLAALDTVLAAIGEYVSEVRAEERDEEARPALVSIEIRCGSYFFRGGSHLLECGPPGAAIPGAAARCAGVQAVRVKP